MKSTVEEVNMRVAASRRGGALAQFCPWGWRWFSSLAPPRPLKKEPSRIGGRCGGGSEHPSRHPAVARAPPPLTPKPETRNLKPNPSNPYSLSLSCS
jgi:hypothetical protein